MKKILITLAIVFSSITNAETINYNLFKTEKVVHSSSSILRSLNLFDFKISKETLTKTVVSKPCQIRSRRGRDRSMYNCNEVTTTRIDVAQVIVAFRPVGTTNRRREVNNGKKTEFVEFNIPLTDLSQETIDLLKSRRALFPKRKKFVAHAKELFELSVNRTSYRDHVVSFMTK